MNILIDSQAFDCQQYGGVSNCWVEIIKAILKKNDPDIHIFLSVFGTFNYHLLDSKLVKKQGNYIKENRNLAITELKSGKYDIFIPTLYDTYFLDYIKCPYIQVVHDIVFDIKQKYFNPNVSLYDNNKYKDKSTENIKTLCNNTNHIVAISDNTKKDLIKQYNLNKDNINVIYHGITKVNQEYKRLIDDDYILYVGSRLGGLNYKCFIPFVNQISVFLHNHSNVKVVCTSIDFSNFELELFEQYNIEDRFIHVYASNEDINNLYHFAICHVFSSNYEGFGLPLLEATENECISLYNSNNKCLNEIGNGSFLTYNGIDIYDLNNKLEYIYSLNDNMKQYILSKQKDRCIFFNWETTADKYINLFKRIYEQTNS